MATADDVIQQVKITMGEYTNLKLTTPEDMNVAEEFLRQRGREQKVRGEREESSRWNVNERRGGRSTTMCWANASAACDPHRSSRPD